METAVELDAWEAGPQLREAGEEEKLVRAAREGDRAAFGRLHDRYARMVHGILLARVPRAEAADLVQEVFLTALGKLAGLREIGAFGAWLASIARRRACDHLRRVRPAVELSSEPEQRGSSEAEAEAARVLEAIRSLPEAYCETLLLRLVEGLSGPEIAEQTGLKPGSVRVNLHRGMKLLRERLGLEGGP